MEGYPDLQPDRVARRDRAAPPWAGELLGQGRVSSRSASGTWGPGVAPQLLMYGSCSGLRPEVGYPSRGGSWVRAPNSHHDLLRNGLRGRGARPPAHPQARPHHGLIEIRPWTARPHERTWAPACWPAASPQRSSRSASSPPSSTSPSSHERASTDHRAGRDGLRAEALVGSRLLRPRRRRPCLRHLRLGLHLPPYVYGIVGAVIALGAFRSIVRGAIRDYFRLPRRQKIRGAALPVETISAPPKP